MTAAAPARLPCMRRPQQPAAARRLELPALLCLVAGMALFGRAWTGMRALVGLRAAVTPERPLFWALGQHRDYLLLSWTGLALATAGLALAVVSATITTRDRRRRALAA